MQTDLGHIIEFIRLYPPFSELPEGSLPAFVKQLEVVYFQQGEHLSESPGLVIIRSGAAELRDEESQLIDKCHEGTSFNLKGLNKEHPGISATFIEDSLVYILPQEEHEATKTKYRDFGRFFHSQRDRRIRRAVRYQPKPHEMARSVQHIMSTKIASVAAECSIRETAQQMTEKRVSSVLVLEDKKLLGIVTDRDLRSRVVARGFGTDGPVHTIMTTDPLTIQSDQSIFDATLVMTEGNVHHLPVLDDSVVVGMISTSDLVMAKEDDPVHLVQHIRRETSAEGIAAIISAVPNLFAQWIGSGIRAHQLSHILTAISDAVCQRLIDISIEELGPPPVPFAWLGFGSQGRKEQMLAGDQDNGLLISDMVKEEELPWFESLAQQVCDGLNTCGYIHCPGNIMAKNPKWRMPLKQWKKTVSSWARSPTPKAVMHVSIFFDIRCVYGDNFLTKELQNHMLRSVQRNTIFLAALAQNVLDSRPPLGIFRRFVVERNGEHRDELNLKKRGILPLVETVRLHSLAKGISAINTFERLDQLKELKHMSVSDIRNLEDALLLIMQLRCEHQAEHILAGEDADNYIPPKSLSELARKQLKDAFEVIEDSHKSIRMSYRGGMD